MYAQKVSPEIYRQYGIYRNPVRLILNEIAWTFTTGYARTNYTHELNGFYFYQDPTQQFIVFDNGEPLPQVIQGYSGWFNAPAPSEEVILRQFNIPYTLQGPPYNPVNNPLLSPPFVLPDSANLAFEGFGNGIPINLAAHYDYRNFRIGAGWTYERQAIRELRPLSFSDRVRSYTPNFRSTNFNKFYGMLGYKFYQYWNFNFVGELLIGTMRYGSAFDRNAVNSGAFFNLGVNIENEWSEYFRIVVRPSYDFKSYTVQMPGGGAVNHRQNAVMMTVGVSINIPEIPRTPIKSDHAQLKHVITDPETGRLMEVRGQPFWKRQNPKVGENHRKLFRYKLKNRNKLNPY